MTQKAHAVIFLVYIAFIQAAAATAGSVFFSEVMALPPCVLCWYQRIAMYPMAVVLAVGIALRDQRVVYYALPLGVAGLFVAVSHNLLYYNVIPESLAPCTAGISCTTKQIEWAGFITIPLMSLTAFVVTVGCLARSLWVQRGIHVSRD